MFQCWQNGTANATEFHYDPTQAKIEAIQIDTSLGMANTTTHEVNTLWRALRNRGWKIRYVNEDATTEAVPGS